MSVNHSQCWRIKIHQLAILGKTSKIANHLKDVGTFFNMRVDFTKLKLTTKNYNNWWHHHQHLETIEDIIPLETIEDIIQRTLLKKINPKSLKCFGDIQ